MSTCSSLLGQHFAFAHGRTGVLQQWLLRQSDIDRILGAKTAHEVQTIFTELPLTRGIDQSINEPRDILIAIEDWMKQELALMVPEAKRETFNILWYELAAPAISFALKEHHGLTSAISSMPETSLPEDESLSVLQQEVKALDNPLPQEIDDAVYEWLFAAQLRLAKNSGSPLIARYIANKKKASDERTALRQGEVDGEADSAFEKAVAEILSKDIADMWNEALTIEPLFAFATLTLSHLSVLRALLIGKENDLSQQELKSILPPFIPATHYIS